MSIKTFKTLSRRKFLRNCASVAGGSAAFNAMLMRMQLAQAAVTPSDEYKALVCVFLFGGNDSYNMLPPHTQSAYDIYAGVRQNLSIAREDILTTTGLSNGGVDYGFHPSMSATRDLYNSGKLAVIANVGALVETVTRSSFQDNSAKRPDQLFSHNSQQEFVMSLSGSPIDKSGWAARMTSLLENANSEQTFSALPLNISLQGSNPLQRSSSVVPYTISNEGVSRLRYLDASSVGDNDSRIVRRAAVYRTLLQNNYGNIFQREYAALNERAWDLSDAVAGTLSANGPINTALPENNKTAKDLRMVAQMIQAREAFGVKRQIFFVGMGGYDTHANQNNAQPELLQQLSDALSSFQATMDELGVGDQVTTFTASDFGRTLTSNGDGSDHGWGGHQLIMGGAVNGQQIYGSMPSLELNSDDDAGEGRVIPTLAVDQYAATLASWFGLTAPEIANIFPNIGEFADTGGADLGFMSS